jgi:hypothetical protein
VRHSFAKRPIGRRIIALVAAYAVALASLIASLGAEAAAVSPADPSAIICHALAGQSAPVKSGDISTLSPLCSGL